MFHQSAGDTMFFHLLATIVNQHRKRGFFENAEIEDDGYLFFGLKSSHAKFILPSVMT